MERGDGRLSHALQLVDIENEWVMHQSIDNGAPSAGANYCDTHMDHVE
jgi:hypothetical protein